MAVLKRLGRPAQLCQFASMKFACCDCLREPLAATFRPQYMCSITIGTDTEQRSVAKRTGCGVYIFSKLEGAWALSYSIQNFWPAVGVCLIAWLVRRSVWMEWCLARVLNLDRHVLSAAAPNPSYFLLSKHLLGLSEASAQLLVSPNLSSLILFDSYDCGCIPSCTIALQNNRLRIRYSIRNVPVIMSLSDYSSDDSFEAEDSQISHKAVRGLQNAKMNAKGTRGSDAGFSSVRISSGRGL